LGSIGTMEPDITMNIQHWSTVRGEEADAGEAGTQTPACGVAVLAHARKAAVAQHADHSRQPDRRDQAAQASAGKTIATDGSSQLVHALLEHDLVDELHLLVYPIVLGSGKRLFADGTTRIGSTRCPSTSHRDPCPNRSGGTALSSRGISSTPCGD